MTLSIHWKTHEPFDPLLVMEARQGSFQQRTWPRPALLMVENHLRMMQNHWRRMSW
jgi:hypothetical protein